MSRPDALDLLPRLHQPEQQRITDEIAAALLYEGYLLYPYRRTALKNQYRWVFGVLFPHDFSLAVAETEPWVMQTECLLRGEPNTTLQARVRFLHLTPTAIGPKPSPDPVGEETAQREVVVEEEFRRLHGTGGEFRFRFPAQDADGMGYRLLEGRLTLAVRPVEGDVFRLTVRVENRTALGALSPTDRE
jgi:hypothetical protein